MGSDISFLYNYGFLLGICIVLQVFVFQCIMYLLFLILSLLLSILFVIFIMDHYYDIYILMEHLLHLWFYIYIFVDLLFYTWITGIFLYLFLLVIAFLGYVLPWGQMSFWGATVITNVLSAISDLVEWICGSFFVYNPTLNRFFVLHFILPFLMMGFLLFHIFYLHLLGSSHPLISNSNNKITFFSYIFIKDIYGFLILLFFYFLQLGYGFLGISHPDNALEVNILVTPFHIVPEWYFLSFYAKLKTIPDKNSGISILIITILLFFMSDSFGFVCNRFNTGITIYFFFWICFIWIGAEIPKVSFICFCRFCIVWYLLIKKKKILIPKLKL